MRQEISKRGTCARYRTVREHHECIAALDLRWCPRLVDAVAPLHEEEVHHVFVPHLTERLQDVPTVEEPSLHNESFRAAGVRDGTHVSHLPSGSQPLERQGDAGAPGELGAE